MQGLVALVCALLTSRAVCNDAATAAVEGGLGPTAVSAEGKAGVTATATAAAAVEQLLSVFELTAAAAADAAVAVLGASAARSSC
jgi:hypothetical protein